MNDAMVDCVECGWHGKLSETNERGDPDGERMPVCPVCLTSGEVSPVAITEPASDNCEHGLPRRFCTALHAETVDGGR